MNELLYMHIVIFEPCISVFEKRQEELMGD